MNPEYLVVFATHAPQHIESYRQLVDNRGARSRKPPASASVEFRIAGGQPVEALYA
jgi:hypothetical protein